MIFISKKKLDKMIAARINMALSQHGKGCHTIYFGDGYEYTTNRIVHYILEHLNLKIVTTPSETKLVVTEDPKCKVCGATLSGFNQFSGDLYVCKCGKMSGRRP